MRIETGHGQPTSRQWPQFPAAGPGGGASFSSIMAAAAGDAAPAAAGTGAPPDFTAMTRKELFDWMNGKLGSGEMSFDESLPFLGMTIRIPVGAGPGTLAGLDDRERVDFVQKAWDGIAGALARHDEVSRERLDTALRIMGGQKGSAGRSA
mgnify:CR=1 FL=1